MTKSRFNIHIHYKWLLVGLLTTLLLVGFVFAKPTENEKQSVVQIVIADSSNNWYSSGSGVIIDSYPHIITNYHVIEDAVSNNYNIWICFTFSDMEPPKCVGKAKHVKANSSGTGTSYEKSFDLALLEIPIVEVDGKEVNFNTYVSDNSIDLAHVSLNKSQTSYGVDLGDKISIMGYPGAGGDTITYTEGIVSGFETITTLEGDILPWQIKTDAKINAGNSGGGAFDSENNFIGMPVAVAGGQGNIGYIISVPVINAFLDEVHMQFCDSNIDGNCWCKYGYYANSTNTMCLRDPAVYLPEINEQEVDSNTLSCPVNSSLGNDSECYCDSGYEVSSDGKICVKVETTNTQTSKENIILGTQNLSDQDFCPPNSYGSTEGCSCNSGFKLDPTKTSCVLFSDVTYDNPYYDSINFLKNKGILSGYADGTYKPSNTINRAEFIKILISAKFGTSVSPINKACFSDVDSSQWYASYVCSAKENGIVNGYPDGTFRPSNSINYVEALKMLLETYNLKPDAKSNPWYSAYLEKAKQYQIHISSISNDQYVTRAEMAELMKRTMYVN